MVLDAVNDFNATLCVANAQNQSAWRNRTVRPPKLLRHNQSHIRMIEQRLNWVECSDWLARVLDMWIMFREVSTASSHVPNQFKDTQMLRWNAVLFDSMRYGALICKPAAAISTNGFRILSERHHSNLRKSWHSNYAFSSNKIPPSITTIEQIEALLLFRFDYFQLMLNNCMEWVDSSNWPSSYYW